MGQETAKATLRKLGWTARVRPGVLGAWLADVLAPARRTIVETEDGLRFYIDPLSNLGTALLRDGRYEAETEALVRAHLAPGDSFLDVGANEGYFSVLAAATVGERGYVASVEPQSRLCEIVRINMALNGGRAALFQGALGGAKGERTELYLSPALNTGYSSVAQRPRFTRRSETVAFVDPEETLGDRAEFALVKVDVEGFEDAVVRSLAPMLRAGKIRRLLLDYHASVLRKRGVEPETIERMVLDAGMMLEGDSGALGNYRLYRRAG